MTPADRARYITMLDGIAGPMLAVAEHQDASQAMQSSAIAILADIVIAVLKDMEGEA